MLVRHRTAHVLSVQNMINRNAGNKYLAWAYVEAANFMKRYSPLAGSWYQRKASKTNQIVATKVLSNKIAWGCYFIIKDQKPFDPKRLFQEGSIFKKPML